MHARRLPASHGILWLGASFRLFRANPPLLASLTMAYLFLAIMVNALPHVGPFIVPLALPAVLVIIANGCRAIERGRGVSMLAMVHGLKPHRIALVRLGGLHLIGAIVILFVSAVVEGGPFSLAGPGPALSDEEMVGFMARLFVIAIPVIGAFWFAPLLTGWDGVAPMKSVFFSFVAFWRNWRAFVVYGLATVTIAIVLPGIAQIVASAISKALFDALLVILKLAIIFILAPTMMAGVYVSYLDVFHGPNEPE
jgi:hypothetical protein